MWDRVLSQEEIESLRNSEGSATTLTREAVLAWEAENNGFTEYLSGHHALPVGNPTYSPGERPPFPRWLGRAPVVRHGKKFGLPARKTIARPSAKSTMRPRMLCATTEVLTAPRSLGRTDRKLWAEDSERKRIGPPIKIL